MSEKDVPQEGIQGGAASAHHKDNGENPSTISKVWTFIKVFPWTLLMILICVFIELVSGKAEVRGTAVDYLMTVFAVLVLILEISKATDIRVSRFITDLLVSVVGLVIATVLLTTYIMASDQAPAFYLWMVCGILLVDAILSPTISFATALRNMSIG